jgi:hypothetical protein
MVLLRFCLGNSRPMEKSVSVMFMVGYSSDSGCRLDAGKAMRVSTRATWSGTRTYTNGETRQGDIDNA